MYKHYSVYCSALDGKKTKPGISKISNKELESTILRHDSMYIKRLFRGILVLEEPPISSQYTPYTHCINHAANFNIPADVVIKET